MTDVMKDPAAHGQAGQHPEYVRYRPWSVLTKSATYG